MFDPNLKVPIMAQKTGNGPQRRQNQKKIDLYLEYKSCLFVCKTIRNYLELIPSSKVAQEAPTKRPNISSQK